MYANGQDLVPKKKARVCDQGAAIMRDLKCRTDVSAMRAASVPSMAVWGILITIGCCCISAASSTGVQPTYSLHEDIRVPGQHAKGIESFSSLVYAIQSNVSDSSLHHYPLPPVSSLNLQASSQQPQTSAISSTDGNSSLNLPVPIYHPPLKVSLEDTLMPRDTIHPPENHHQEVVPPQPLPNSENASVDGVINQAPPNDAEDTQTSNVDTRVASFDDKNNENPIKHTMTSDYLHPVESFVPSQSERNSNASSNTDSTNDGEHLKDDYHYEYDNLNFYEDGDSDTTSLYQDNGHDERLEEHAVSTEEDTYSNAETASFTTQSGNSHVSKGLDGDLPSIANESSADSTLIANDLFKDDSITSHNSSEGEDYYSEMFDGSITEPSVELLGNSLEPIGMPTSEHIVTVTPPTPVEGAEHMDYYLDYNDTLPSESTINEGDDGNHDTHYDYYDGQEPNSKNEENTGQPEQQPDQNINGDDPLLDGNEKVQEVSVFDAEQGELLEEMSHSQLDNSRQDNHNVESEVLEIQPEILEDQPEDDVSITTTTVAPKAGGSVSVVSYTDSEVDYQAKAQQELKEQPINEDVSLDSAKEKSAIPTITTTARSTTTTKTTTQRTFVYAPRTVPSLYSTTTKTVTTEKTTTTEAPATTTSTALPTTTTSPSPSVGIFSSIETGVSNKLMTITDKSFTVSDSQGHLETSKEDSTTQHSTEPSVIEDVQPEENTEPLPPTTTSSPTQSIVDVIQSLNLPGPKFFGEKPIMVTEDHLNIPAPNISEHPDVFHSDAKVSTNNKAKSNVSVSNVYDIHEDDRKTTTSTPYPTTSAPTSSEAPEIVKISPKNVTATHIAANVEPIILAADAILTDSNPSSVLPEFSQSTTAQSKEDSPKASYEHAAADNVKSAFDTYSSTTSTTTSETSSATTTTATTTVTSKTDLSNVTAAIKGNPGAVGAPTESVPQFLLPSGFSTEEPVSVVLVPLKSRNLSRGRKLGSLFDQIFERQQKANKTAILPIAIDPAVKNLTDILGSKTNSSGPDVANITAIPESSAENDTAAVLPTTKRPAISLRRRFPTLSRKPFLASRAPSATRAPFKIATRKTSDILKHPRVTIKPIGRRTNPHAEYPSDPDNRPGETTEATPPTTTTKRIVTTLSPYFLWGQSVEVACTLRIHGGVEWSQDLEDHSSPTYRDLSNDIGKELDALFRRSDFGNRYKGIQIEGFSRGSVIVDYTLYLTEEDDPVETPLLWEAISKALENGTNMGDYVVDPGNLSFEVIRKITPPPEILNDGLLLPHWAIAVIVIAAASLLFLIILCLALTRNKRGVKRKYANVLKEGSITDRAKDWDKSAYDNLGASSSIYDINDTWDEKKLKQQQRSYNNYNLYSVHPPSTGSGHYAPKSTGSGQYGMKKSASQMSDHFPPEDPYSQGRYYDSWRSDWSRSARGSSKPPDYDTTF